MTNGSPFKEVEYMFYKIYLGGSGGGRDEFKGRYLNFKQTTVRFSWVSPPD